MDIQEQGSPIRIKATEAVLLQVMINLFDNSLYWLKYQTTNRRVLIRLDGDSQKLIFADNGPGIHEDDEPYIFEAFYSGKGEDGRGLGLYIARQLLERYGYAIHLADCKSDRLLEGAVFVIDFLAEE